LKPTGKTRTLSMLGGGFLNQVFGCFAILCEPMSDVVQVIEERDGQFFERVELKVPC
jgi:hypothetical protein